MQLNRWTYCTWQAVYEFSRRSPRSVAQPLPREVLRELSAAIGMAPFLRASLCLKLHPKALMTDASPTGGAVGETPASVEELRENMRYGERAM